MVLAIVQWGMRCIDRCINQFMNYGGLFYRVLELYLLVAYSCKMLVVYDHLVLNDMWFACLSRTIDLGHQCFMASHYRGWYYFNL